jgi:ankyrin repeat protein
MYAAESASTAVIPVLGTMGAEPDKTNPEGKTALMLAAGRGNTEAAVNLVALGAKLVRQQSTSYWRRAQISRQEQHRTTLR